MAFGDRAKQTPLRLVRGSDVGDAVANRRPDLDDAALVAAIHAGDVKAASRLCDRLWPQVDRTIRRLLGRVDSDHDDVAQIALMEIVTTIRRYRGDCSLDRWAQTVTAHAVFKHIRRRNLERRVFTSLVSEDSFALPLAIGERAMHRQLLGRIADHLDGMNEPRAWAFLLHDALGYDLHEIAEMTDSSVAAAQSRLSRGRRELHDRIADDPELAELLRTHGGSA